MLLLLLIGLVISVTFSVVSPTLSLCPFHFIWPWFSNWAADVPHSLWAQKNHSQNGVPPACTIFTIAIALLDSLDLMALLNVLSFFNLAAASLLLVGVRIIFLYRLYNIVHFRYLLRHLLYWLLRHFESLIVDFFHLVELLPVLLLHHGKHHCRIVFLFFFIDGFFFDVVGAVKICSLVCCGALELRAILVQFAKV